MAYSSLSSIPVHNRILKHRSARVSKPQQLSYDMLPCRPDCYKLNLDRNKNGSCTQSCSRWKSIQQAAEEHGVPCSTLHDCVTGKVVPGTKSGPRKHLTFLEKEFVEFLKHCSAIGYGKVRKQAVSLVQEALDKKGTSTQVILSWLKSFNRRHLLKTWGSTLTYLKKLS